MKEIKWDLMKPEQVEVRIASIKDGTTRLVLYQDSRNTMEALDAAVGQGNWQITYKAVGDKVYGCLSIWDDERNQWISKEDTGSESNIEGEKGQSSDILKRCAVRWGYGRELYTSPKIFISNTNKFAQFTVYSISYNEEREIIALTIVDSFGNIVYDWTAAGYCPQCNSEGEEMNPMESTSENKPVEVRGFAPSQYPLAVHENPIGADGRLIRPLYLDIIKAKSLERLTKIWDMYPNLQNVNVFRDTLSKRKAELKSII